jgi:hypothetical protein
LNTSNPKDFGLSGESIICFAGEDWWYHHPHSKNHILKRLAGCNKVLFVNSITMGLPPAGSPDFWLKVRRKARSYLRWLRRVPEGLWVMTPITLPFFGSALARWANRELMRFQFWIALRWIGMNTPVIWVAIPSAVDIAESLPRKTLLYQVSDKYDQNEDSALARETIQGFDRRLKALASVVMYSGRRLFEEAEDVPHRYYLEQAADFDHFSVKTSDVPPDMADIPHPILFYMGAMDFIMDTELITEVARLRPDWHWVFVGLLSNSVRLAGPNIHYLGTKKYQELPAYVHAADVCVLPWRQQNAFTSYGSAIKVREYLASGKPVVICPIYEYLKTPGVRTYHSPAEFIAQAENALREDGAEQGLRSSRVRHDTWDDRARQVAALIRSLGSVPGARYVAKTAASSRG